MLTIYANNPGGNLVHKHKTLKFDAVVERLATKYIQISWKSIKIASPHITAHMLFSFLNGPAKTI